MEQKGRTTRMDHEFQQITHTKAREKAKHNSKIAQEHYCFLTLYKASAAARLDSSLF
jgi:hypothetical protein